MKKLVFAALLLLSCLCPAAAQENADYYKAQYERQKKVLGPDGVGIETILDRWAQAFPEDGDMLEGRFLYYLAKSRSLEMVMRKEKKYLGQKPTLELKDSLGTPFYYYQLPVFDDSLYALSSSAIDKAVSLYPHELAYRADKIASLLAYERESPDMAEAEVMNLIRMNASHPAWTYYGEPGDDDLFQELIQGHCYTFFTTGTPRSYEAFLKVSEQMSKMYPKTAVYLSNIGSYWFVAKDNPKKAATYYKKALKLDPEEYAATRNMKLIQSSQSQKGRSSR